MRGASPSIDDRCRCRARHLPRRSGPREQVDTLSGPPPVQTPSTRARGRVLRGRNCMLHVARRCPSLSRIAPDPWHRAFANLNDGPALQAAASECWRRWPLLPCPAMPCPGLIDAVRLGSSRCRLGRSRIVMSRRRHHITSRRVASCRHRHRHRHRLLPLSVRHHACGSLVTFWCDSCDDGNAAGS